MIANGNASFDVENENDKTNHNNETWTCNFCHNNYSRNYKHKIHLTKCLVHKKQIEDNNCIMVELKNELKDEFKQEFLNI